MKPDLTKLKKVGKSAVRYMAKNSPSILEGLSIGGYLASVALGINATIKSVKLVEEIEDERGYKLSKKEVVKETWPLYISTAATALLATACGYASIHESNKRNASLAVGYGFYEASYNDLKEKYEQFIGKKKQQEIQDELADERINSEIWDERTVIVTDTTTQLFMDELTGIKFFSDVTSIQKGINAFNHYWIRNEGYCNVDDDEPSVNLDEVLSYIPGLSLGTQSKLAENWIFRFKDGPIEEDLRSAVTIKSGPYAGKTAILLRFRNKAMPAPYLFYKD